MAGFVIEMRITFWYYCIFCFSAIFIAVYPRSTAEASNLISYIFMSCITPLSTPPTPLSHSVVNDDVLNDIQKEMEGLPSETTQYTQNAIQFCFLEGLFLSSLLYLVAR